MRSWEGCRSGIAPPLILCYLERLPREMAAARLGLSLGRLHGRLDRGRGFPSPAPDQTRSDSVGTIAPAQPWATPLHCPPMVVISSARAAGAYRVGGTLNPNRKRNMS